MYSRGFFGLGVSRTISAVEFLLNFCVGRFSHYLTMDTHKEKLLFFVGGGGTSVGAYVVQIQTGFMI